MQTVCAGILILLGLGLAGGDTEVLNIQIPLWQQASINSIGFAMFIAGVIWLSFIYPGDDI
jgi:ABC-type arginine transport system permease subunit